MEAPSRQTPRVPRRSRLPWRSTRPRILKGGEDSPLSPTARFEYRLVLVVVVAVGVYALLIVELTRR